MIFTPLPFDQKISQMSTEALVKLCLKYYEENCELKMRLEQIEKKYKTSWKEAFEAGEKAHCASQGKEITQAIHGLIDALQLAVRQNSHDMLMTNDEIRSCEGAIQLAVERDRARYGYGEIL